MKKLKFIMLLAVIFLVSCSTKEVEELKTKISDLEQEIAEKDKAYNELSIENVKLSTELNNVIKDWENFVFKYISEPNIYKYYEYKCTKIETLKVLEKIDINRYDETGPYIIVEKDSRIPKVVKVPLEIYDQLQVNKYYRFTFESSYNLNHFLFDATKPVRDLVLENMNTVLKYETEIENYGSTWFSCSQK